MWRDVVRYSIIAILALTPPALAQETPPAPPVPPSAPNRTEPVPLNLNRFVPSAEERTVAFFSALFPDCSSKGEIVGRINSVRPVREIMYDLVNECVDTLARMGAMVQT